MPRPPVGRTQTQEEQITTAPTLTGQAQAAICDLQAKARTATDTYRLDRIDRALDELLRLNGSGPARHQTRSAMSHAADVLRDRRRIAPMIPLDETYHAADRASDCQTAVIDLRAWLQTTRGLADAQRRLLTLIADHDVETIAAMDGVPPARIRERVSRARQAARTAYYSDVIAA